MFEKRIINTSGRLKKMHPKKFYILTHRKHRREIYFDGSEKSIKFMKTKFNSPFKEIVYFLIGKKILQFFLKKIFLPSSMGNVIFVGGQIKAFNLEEKTVISFPLRKDQEKHFIDSKKFQREMAKKGFSAKIYKINKKVPYSVEDLLRPYGGGNISKVFEKLLKYYASRGIVKVRLSEYIKSLKKIFEKTSIRDSFFQNIFENIKKRYPKNLVLNLVFLHGDFSKEQVLEERGEYFFTDWESEEGLIIRDLVKFFRDDDEFFCRDSFKEVLNVYPKNVIKNLEVYLLLNEIHSAFKRPDKISEVKKRIENILKNAR